VKVSPRTGGVRRLGALADPKAKIDWDKWWKSWKRMDIDQQRAFEKSLNEPWGASRSKTQKPARARSKRA
jgi:hypothetical protein